MNRHPKSSSNFDLQKYAIDNVVDGIYWCDEQARIFDVNKGACKMVGYSREELTSMTVADIDPNFPIDKWPEHWDQIRKQGAVKFESIHRTKDGRLINVEITANLINYDGQELNCAIVRDISERIKAQLKSEVLLLRHQVLMKSALEGIHVMDVQGNIIEANDTFSHMLGYTQEELSRMNVADWDAQWSKEELMERFKQLIRSNSALFETKHRRKDGTLIDVEVSTTGAEINGKFFLYASSRDISERKHSEQAIHQLAFYDPLTKLPNRRLLVDRLQQASVSCSRNGRESALLFIDLDHFKNLNDTLGHDTGDILLQQAAHRLESCIRKGDTVARLGGDEFVVMLLELGTHALEAAALAEEVGKKILDVLKQPYQFNKNTYRCTASIGITLFSGNQQTTDELMKQADIAMYQAKKFGRNSLRFFDRQMQENISARVTLENELQDALELQQFHVYYQIQTDSAQHPLGAEALIRWMHPERGLLSSTQFIPLAEETGQIIPLGHWVLETACAQLKAWQHGELTRDLTLAVNVSARQFRQADFVAQLQAFVKSYAINPKLLKLELTESLLQENIEETIAAMSALSEMGVQFSLDDFGTGYSSLQYLKQLPFDQLKIDKSFVHDIAINSSDKAVVRAIIAMAKSMDLDVIAEGVETEEQRQLLLENGCTHYQGYLFGNPVPIGQFAALIQ
jgi:diguanylate cyclase (GGDEF)-like protein/PAS domain S-box-containing protein